MHKAISGIPEECLFSAPYLHCEDNLMVQTIVGVYDVGTKSRAASYIEFAIEQCATILPNAHNDRESTNDMDCPLPL